MLSPTTDFDDFLAILFVAWTIVLSSVVVIFIRAISTSFTGLFFSGASVRAAKERAYGAVIGGLDLFAVWMTTLLELVAQSIAAMFSIGVYFLGLVLLAGILHVLYLYYPPILGSATQTWNNSVGHLWASFVLDGLNALQSGFEQFIGVYNLAVFIFLKLPTNLFMNMLAHGTADIVAFGKELGAAGQSFSDSAALFGNAVEDVCKQNENSTSITGSVNMTCFNPELRDFDFVATMKHVNRAAVHVLRFLPRQCTILQQPLALLLYPFTDTSMGYALHHFLNAGMHVVHSILLSVERVKMTGRAVLGVPDFSPVFDHLIAGTMRMGQMVDNWLDVAFYMTYSIFDPRVTTECDDVGGSWDFDTASAFGFFGKNRTTIVSLTPSMFAVTDGYDVEYHHHGRRGGIRPGHAAWPIPVNVSYGIAAVSYARDFSRDDVSSGHTTSLLGCSCVDDGLEGLQLICAIVPYEVFDGVNQAAFITNITWEVANTPKRLACRDTKISVESVRHPTMRYTSPNEFQYGSRVTPPITCLTEQTCTSVDAAVWIMPVCPVYSAPGMPPGDNTACVDGLRDFSCFPFCLGMRRAFSANEPLLVRSSSTWEDNVLLSDRDCVFEWIGDAAQNGRVSSATILDEKDGAAGSWVLNSGNPVPALEMTIEEGARVKRVKFKTPLVQEGQEGTLASQCIVAPQTVSSVPLLKEQRYNSSQMFQDLHSFGSGWEHADDLPGDLYRFSPTVSMLHERQPLVFAGDFALRTVTYCVNGALWDGNEGRLYGQGGNSHGGRCDTVLDVLRVSGNEHNEFRLVHAVPSGMAVTKRPTTIAQTADVLREGAVTLPPVVVRSVYTHNPATVSRDAVWYAVNPDYEMVHCILRYCSGFEELVNCLQFSVLSNYERLRIWKLVPFAGCTRGAGGQPDCPPHAATSVYLNNPEHSLVFENSENFDVASFCDPAREYDLFVDGMEELDPLNIVVSVRRGNAAGLYQEIWGSGGPATVTASIQTVFYFLHTETLEIREGRPWTDVPVVPQERVSFICDDMRFMPSLGSAMAEAFSAGMFALKIMVRNILGIGNIAEIYANLDHRCGLQGFYHSAYNDCGTKIFDLTDMFDALHRGNVHAWGILDSIGRVLSFTFDNDAAESLSTFLSGVRNYQENRIVLSKTRLTRSVMRVVNTNTESFMSGYQRATQDVGFHTLLFGIGTPRFMAGMSVGASPLAVAEYGQRVFSRMLDRVIVLSTKSVANGDSGALTARYVAGNMTAVWYESIYTDWEDLVANRHRRLCSGISLMMGYTNSWAELLRHWCLAGVEMVSGTNKALGGFMVELPLAICVCHRAPENDFPVFVRDVCVPEAPLSLRPFVTAMLAWERDIFDRKDIDALNVINQVCLTTMDQFKERLFNVFTPWAAEHTAAATATISLFDYLSVLMGKDSANCASYDTNPLVTVIIPVPTDYFHVCGDTSMCKVRCKPYFDALEKAVTARGSSSATLPPLAFRTTIESSLFERHSWDGNREDAVRLLALTELETGGHADCACREGSDCVGVLASPYPNGNAPVDHLLVRTYCAPQGIQERIYLGKTWKMETRPGEWDMEKFLDPDTQHGFLRIVFSHPHGDHVIALSREVDTVVGELFYADSFEQLTVWRSSSAVPLQLVASSSTLTETCRGVIENALGPAEGSGARADGSVVWQTPTLSKVKIIDFVNLASEEYSLEFVLHIDATVVYSGEGGDTTDTPATEMVSMYVRLGWCEYLPPSYQGPIRTEPTYCVHTWQTHATCGIISNALGIELFHEWLGQGNLMYMPTRRGGAGYIWLPTQRTAGSRRRSSIRRFDISLNNQTISTDDLDDPLYPLSSTSLTAAALGVRPYLEPSRSVIDPVNYQAYRNSMIAHWRPVAITEGVSGAESLWYSVASAAIARAWLKDVRYDPAFLVLRSFATRQEEIEVEVVRYCNGHTCGGCKTLQLKQLCTALQMCMTTQCFGSTVNHGDLMCDAGMLVETLYSQSISLYVAGWNVLVSVVVSSMDGSVYEDGVVRMEWSSDMFYAVMCEAKDVTAAATAFVATMVYGREDGLAALGIQDGDSDIVYGLGNMAQLSGDAGDQKALYAASLHQFLYQVALGPLYYMLGMYRWGVCKVADVVSEVSFGHVRLALDDMEDWGPCSPAATVGEILSVSTHPLAEQKLSSIVNDAYADEDGTGRDIAASVGKVPVGSKQMVSGAVAKTHTVSAVDPKTRQITPKQITSSEPKTKRKRQWRALGVLHHLLDAAIAWGIGIVTGMQDIMYNNDDPDCRVSDVVIADAVTCACGDTPAYIIRSRRTARIDALWCTGVLFMPLDDGSMSYVYNPFSMEELGEKLAGYMNAHLECISSSGNDCPPLPAFPPFDAIGVNPMSVLTRCRANYVQRQWDAGMHALFDPDFEPSVAYTQRPFDDARTNALAWAENEVSDPRFFACVTAAASNAANFPECIDYYMASFTNLDLGSSVGTRRESYFAYTTEPDRIPPPNNPDACMLFTGPATLAGSSNTRDKFTQCVEGDAPAGECTLPMLAWSGNLKSRVPVGSVHRDAVESQGRRESITRNLYARAQQDVRNAFDVYNAHALAEIDVLFFSADGDVLHQALDCMFLGPYAKVDYVIGSPDGRLKDLTWYRDNNTGDSRDFDLPCTGEKLHGDKKGTPFTCGSPARRSVIKSYVRDYLFEGVSAANVTASLITDRLQLIEATWANITNYGCFNPLDSSTSFSNCGDPLKGGVGYTPNLPDFTEVTSNEVTAKVMEKLPTFFTAAMTDSRIWTKYYVDDVHTEAWGDWYGNAAVKDYHMFAPHSPTVSYNASEGFNATSTNEDSELFAPMKNSIWGICTSLLSQPMLTIPLIKYEEDGLGEHGPPNWMPRFVRDQVLGAYDPYTTDSGEWIDSLLQEAWMHSPMYMHYVMRYRPSMSMICEDAVTVVTDPQSTSTQEQHDLPKVVFHDAVLHVPSETDDGNKTTKTIRYYDTGSHSIPVRGFLSGAIGEIHRTCPCSAKTDVRGVGGVSVPICAFSAETCATLKTNILASVGGLVANATNVASYQICEDEDRTFSITVVATVYQDLWQYGQNLSCPELHLSDHWGLFPFNEDSRSENEKWLAGINSRRSGSEFPYDLAELLANRRLGINPASLLHTTNEINGGGVAGHDARAKPLSEQEGKGAAQRQCTTEAYVTDPPSGFEVSLVDDFFNTLFPVAQLVYEPSGASICTRFVLEHLKHRFLVHAIGIPNTADSELSVSRWRDRCGIKARQAASCNALGVLHIIPPRPQWKAILPPSCTFPLDENAFFETYRNSYYITPGCVMYAGGSIYDLHRCRTLNSSLPFHPSSLQVYCGIERLDPEGTVADAAEETHIPKTLNPMAISHTSGNGVLHWGSGTHFDDGVPAYRATLDAIAKRQDSLEDSNDFRIDLSKAFVHALFDNLNIPPEDRQSRKVQTGKGFGNISPNRTEECSTFFGCKEAVFCDKTFDWWPEDWHNPLGYHPTATCRAEDHAYRTFDSYLSIDREDIQDAPFIQLAYQHTLLRDADLLYRWGGSGGLCRLHSAFMPLFETNTFRACTRAPNAVKNPALPHDRPLPGDMANEQCADSSGDVPWDTKAAGGVHPQYFSVGGVHDIFRFTAPLAGGGVGREILGLHYPSSLTEIPSKEAVFPKAGVRLRYNSENPWGDCTPPVTISECDTRDAGSCPESMVCVQSPTSAATVGLCFPTDHHPEARPCYRSDMCDVGTHCTAEGYCERVNMHLWNLDTKPLEFTSLVKDNCGIETDATPKYSQTFAGASPWETVPDLLQGHGLCAQRHQYAYTYGMSFKTEGKTDTHAYLRGIRDGEDADTGAARFVWPWVQQDPSGHLLDEDRDKQDSVFMHVHPHVCDRDYMHMDGFLVCSGVQGDKNIGLVSYPLDRTGANRNTIADWVPLTEGVATEALNVTHWLRTGDRNDLDRVLVSPIFNSAEYVARGAMAFLGGDQNAPAETYAGAVGSSRARFMQCINLQLCGIPGYTFNGYEVARGSYVGSGGRWRKMHASDVEQCGSIGFALTSTTCEFDLRLFPHIRLLIAGSSEYCTKLFGSPSGSQIGDTGAVISVLKKVADVGAVCENGRICCVGDDTASVECHYRAIIQDVAWVAGSGQMQYSIYMNMVDQLNSILTLGTLPQDFGNSRQTARVASGIAECLEDMVLMNRYYQQNMATDFYASLDGAPSGIYYVLPYHLYEVPMLWYYKWMYKSLVWSSAWVGGGGWDGQIVLGEAWDSRTGLSDPSIPRCPDSVCVCTEQPGGIKATARDSLLCLNAAIKDRPTIQVAGDDSGDVADDSAVAFKLSRSAALDEYVAALKVAINEEVMIFIETEYGISRTQHQDGVPGCYTAASWDILACRDNLACIQHIVSNASGTKCYGEECFTPLNREMFFDFDDTTYARGAGEGDIFDIAERIVNSYEFIDETFDPLDIGVVDSGSDSEWRWQAGLFRLLDRAILTDEYDNIKDTGGQQPEYVFDARTSQSAKECIFEGFNTYESLAVPNREERPWVDLRPSEDAPVREHLQLDICSATADRGTKWSHPLGWRGDGEVTAMKMNCAFQDTPELHGRDFCDIDYDAYCSWNRPQGGGRPWYLPGFLYDEIESHDVRMPPEYSSETWDFVSDDNAVQEDLFQTVPLRIHTCPHFVCQHKRDSRRVSEHMACRYTPALDTCRQQGWTVPLDPRIQGGEKWSKHLNIFWGADHPPFPDRYDGASSAGAGLPGLYSFGGLTNGDLFWDRMPGTWWKEWQGFLGGMIPPKVLKHMPEGTVVRSRCPAHIWQHKHKTKGFTHAYNTIEQDNALHSMCHRVDDPCTGGLREEFVEAGSVQNGESHCKIRYAKLPPGVAGRFFTTTKDPALWPTDPKRPVWAECPHEAPGDTSFAYGDWRIPMERKARSTWYKGPSCAVYKDIDLSNTDIIPCTQQSSLTSEYGTCESDAGCYIFDADKSSEWSIEKSPQCRDLGGVCMYSLTLAKGFFCGTAIVTDGIVDPPDYTCPNSNDHIFLVRGSESARSLWKCDKCVEYVPEHFKGKMKCGVRSQNGPDGEYVTYNIRDMVHAVKDYIRSEIHTIDKLRQIHKRYTALAYNGVRAWPNYPGPTAQLPMGNTVFIPLQELSFASSFETWGGSAEGDCVGSIVNTDPELIASCPWRQYHISPLMQIDKYYQTDIGLLQCTVDTPSVHEFQQCSSNGSDTPRQMLRDWVDKLYRHEQGTWLPVLPVNRGVSWRLDRSAVSNPFTIMFASTHRPLREKHVGFTLSDGACLEGARVRSMCAVSADGLKAYVANPWLGGEFNTGERDSSLLGMGLDQCRRIDGVWQTCCSCFPKSMCCYPTEECAEGENPPRVTSRVETNYFGADKHSGQCRSRDFQTPVGQPMSETDAGNLCRRDPFGAHRATCTHRQGILGGGSGSAVESIDALYHHSGSGLTTKYSVEPFLTAAEPVLWAGKSASQSINYRPGTHAIVNMPDELMYPGHIIAVVRHAQQMQLHSVQMLQNNRKLFHEAQLKPSIAWIPDLASNLHKNYVNTIKRLYPLVGRESRTATAGNSWVCPLRMASFWGKHTPGFNPLIPDPMRADFMFSGAYYCHRANASCTTAGVHPYHAPVEYPGIKDFMTTDGVCYYDPHYTDKTMVEGQQIKVSDTAHPCGFHAHVHAVLQGTARTSKIMTPASTDCSAVLDWPSAPLPYRNGEEDPRGHVGHNSTTTDPQSCPLFQRVAPFAMRFKNNAPLRRHPGGRTTMDSGGDCHMGRATRMSKTERQNMLTQYEHCVTVARTATQASIRCTGYRGAGGRLSAEDRVFVLERETRQRPLEDVIMGETGKPMAQCGQCDASTAKMQGPGESTLDVPETSVGVMQRIDAERFMAFQLRQACEKHPGCEIDSLLWREDYFMSTLAQDMGLLLKGGSADPSAKNFQDEIEELPDAILDDTLWLQPWILYNSDGGGIGTADKTTWKRNRWGECSRAVDDAVAQDPTDTFVRPIGFCDVTGDLQDLCSSLLAAKADIETANCIASNGDCEVLASYYTPAQWSPTNKAFARETVRDFYNYEATDACEGDLERVENARAENSIVQAECSATHMQAVKEGLELVRLGVRMILAGFMSLNAIVIDVFLLVFYSFQGKDARPIVGDILYQLQNLVELWAEALRMMMDVLIYLLSSISDMGQYIAWLFWIICQAVTFFYEVVIQSFMCILVRVATITVFGLIDGIVKGLESLSTFGLKINAKPWNKFKGQVDGFVGSLDCKDPFSVSSDVASGNAGCSQPGFDDIDAQSITHSFLPTRCWANPTPGDLLGETNVLGCSSSDTCILDAFSGPYDVCEACPDVDVANFQRFGCDMSLRRCKCGVPIVSRTSCLRNSDCWANTPCALVASTGSQAYGTVDCQERCSHTPICFISGDSPAKGLPSVGECICSLTEPLAHGCESTTGLMALPVDSGTCLFARDRTLAGTMAAYASTILEIGSLTMANCPLLRRSGDSKFVCQRVRSTTGAIRKVVVGTELVSLSSQSQFRRRLLWDNASVDLANPWHAVVPRMLDDQSVVWTSSATGVCADLIQAYRRSATVNPTEMGVVDRHTLRECVKWRAIANTTADMFNMSETLPDTVFLTWSNTLSVFVDHLVITAISPRQSPIIKNPVEYIDMVSYVILQMESGSRILESLRRLRAIAVRFWRRVVGWERVGSGRWNATVTRQERESNRSRGERGARPSWVENPPVYDNITDWIGRHLLGNDEGKALFDSEKNAKLWARQDGCGIVSMTVSPAPLDDLRPTHNKYEWELKRFLWSSNTSREDMQKRLVLAESLVKNMAHGLQAKGATRSMLQNEDSEQWPLDWSVFLKGRDPSLLTCELYDVAEYSIGGVYASMRDYYERGYLPRNSTSFRLRDNLMDIVERDPEYDKHRDNLVARSQEGAEKQGIILSMIDWVLNWGLSLGGLHVNHVIDFMDPPIGLQAQIEQDLFTFPRLVYDMGHCHVHRVMVCDSKPKQLLSTVIICALMLYLVGWGFSLSSGTVMLMTVVLLPWLVMWYSYGYSPACFPMVPTCFLADFARVVNATLPAKMEWPALLIKQSICNREGVPYNTSLQGQVNCFKSCATEEFRFRSYEDSFAWLLCDIDIDTCKNMSLWLVGKTVLAQSYHDTTTYFTEVLQFGNSHLTDAHRMCAILTGFYIIPVFLFVVWSLFMVVAFLKTILILFTRTVLYALSAPQIPAEDPSATLDDEDGAHGDDADISEGEGAGGEREGEGVGSIVGDEESGYSGSDKKKQT